MIKTCENLNILLLEDDLLAARSFKNFLESKGHNVLHAKNLDEALNLLQISKFAISFVDLDLNKERGKGYELLPHLKERGIYSIILTGNNADSKINKGYELGCSDYLIKPFTNEVVEKAFIRYQSKAIEKMFQDIISKEYLTQDEGILQQLSKMSDSISSREPIFIDGPTGTGKSFLAQLIHKSIFGNLDTFVDWNCASVSESMIDSVLFGYVKGAFTGADSNRDGLLKAADGGTLFLDEIASMPMATQLKLLKAIEEKSFYPVGSTVQVSSNFNIISATCDDLLAKVDKGTFRKDFYNRISGKMIELPALHERPKDISLIIKAIIKKSQRGVTIKKDAMNALRSYKWPGNIRELSKFVERCISSSKPIVTFDDLPKKFKNNEIGSTTNSKFLTKTMIKFVDQNGRPELISEITKELVSYYDGKHNNVKRKTIRKLDMSPNSYYKFRDEIDTENRNENYR